MAIVLKLQGKFEQAKAIAGDDEKKLIEEYKKLTPGWLEGDNEFIDRQPGFFKIFDKIFLKKSPKQKKLKEIEKKVKKIKKQVKKIAKKVKKLKKK